MERRASKRVESLRASHRIERLLSPSIDPKLWGNLPSEVLVRIYQALSIRDFYKLRVVCKEWNNVACERRCFNDLVPSPYFLLFSSFKDQYSPTGTLAYNVSSGRWIWRRYVGGFRQVGDLDEHFVVEGIFFDYNSMWTMLNPTDYFRVEVPQNLLFDVQTDKSWRAFEDAIEGRRIPELPRLEGGILGMMVETSKRPHTYKLIMGNSNAHTQILDSRTNTWEPKPSRMVRCKQPSRSSSPKSCVQCEGHMYVWSDSDEIHVYSLVDDKWSALNAPPRHASNEEFRGLGHWQSELYAITKNEHGTLSIWKLSDRDMQKWTEFERIPSNLFSYLLKPGVVLPIVIAHCKEYLLMHVRTDCDGVKGDWWQKLGLRVVLFNISNKRWEVVALPYTQLWGK